MLSWFSSRNENIRHVFPSVEGRSRFSECLKKMYDERLLPLEEFYHFHDFHSFRIEDSEFDSKPMVLLVGQYSTGKTTFIKSVIEQDYPGMRIGPEPTTDNFVIVTDGHVETIIPGNALVSDKAQPFCPLSRFGNSFLNRLQMATVSNPVLENITFVDTPGVASGAKHQKMHRGYDFAEVIAWFANHADRIILFFDACKLDISDELKKIFEIVRANDDKLRVVFNKADMLSDQELMRGYGALMWFLGRALPAPEPSRLFIVSFWMSELINDDNRRLLELEAQDLYQDLQTLPRSAAIRKVNDLIKRARLAKVHAYIINELFQSMPTASAIFGRRFSGILSVGQNRRSRESLLDKLPDIYDKLQRRKDLSLGDFPSIRALRERLMSFDFEIKLQPLKQKLIDDVDAMLAGDASPLMSALISGRSNLFAGAESAQANGISPPIVAMDYQMADGLNGVSDGQVTSKEVKGQTLTPGIALAPVGVVRDTPFAPGKYEGLNAGSDCFLAPGKSNFSSRDGTLETQKSANIVRGTPFENINCYDENCCWGIDPAKRSRYSQIFIKLAGEDGKANGEAVREELLKSKLPTPVLAKIWRLSDIDRDNFLDEDEFALAMYLVEMKHQGVELPQVPALTVVSGNTAYGGKQRTPLPMHLIPPSKRHLVYF